MVFYLCKNSGGSPIICPNQSMTKDSSSVQAGELAYNFKSFFSDLKFYTEILLSKVSLYLNSVNDT